MGPCPAVFNNVRNSGDMLNFFISMIPENALLSESKLSEKLAIGSVKGETWIEMLAALRKIELGEWTVGQQFNEAVALRMDQLGIIPSSENLSSLVFHQGWTHVIYESMLPALSIYLKKGGSLETLKLEPANATKFEETMKDEVYRFSIKPVLSGKVSGDQLAGLCEIAETGEVTKRLFGTGECMRIRMARPLEHRHCRSPEGLTPGLWSSRFSAMPLRIGREVNVPNPRPTA